MTSLMSNDFGVGRRKLLIGGQWVDSAGADVREILNPKDETTVDVVASTIEDAERAIAAARAAQPAWVASTPMERASESAESG
jgi:acyl-CoA reductase-like NAD-dependent aldehyde dehydrogenase